MIQEIERKPVHGGVAFTVLTAAGLATAYWLYEAATSEAIVSSIAAVLLFSAEMFCYRGLMFVYPNEARVLVLFGAYKGTARDPGWRWVNPFYLKLKLSVRVRNFETGRMKVNDRDGNPIEIAAVVVWKVTDTAEASFEVDDYVNYVHVQSEAAVRNLAVHYTYDTHDDAELSLRGSTDHVAANLREQIEARLERAGIAVIEARISHLAYAPEIAEAMLRRQQAGAIIAARQKIVEGAVGMVDMALALLKEQSIVELDEERKAAMVSNLLVVLCSEHHAQPVLNTGSLYT
jgi:regulator of protease activity HflC (stomatin/prohibitin superfamily)